MAHPSGLRGKEIGEWYRDKYGGRSGGGAGGAGRGRTGPSLTPEERENRNLEKRLQDPAPQKLSLSPEAVRLVSAAARTVPAGALDSEFADESTKPAPHRSSRRWAPDNNAMDTAVPHESSPRKPMLEARRRLPAWKLQDHLVQAVQNNSVVVVSGETGCGKTTQVPQFLLDAQPAAQIICTQPRRISAVAVAERVAAERGSALGQQVGYQIRLESHASPHTRLLFCTTGILLRRLQSDPSLNGITHVIVDEIHERTLDADFLLIILRDLVNNPRNNIRLVLMSATLNAELFASYFAGAPTVHIPGFTFPVTEFFLEDVIQRTRYQFPEPSMTGPQRHGDPRWRQKKRALKERDLEIEIEQLQQSLGGDYTRTTLASLANATHAEGIPLDLVEELCVVIDNEDPHKSAVLIFLPGWDDISKLCDRFNAPGSRFRDKQRFRVLPLHSSLPTVNQREIFDRPPSGVRKIIVATNIAETSITVDDVVYVIDSGKFKEKTYDPETNVSCLLPSLVSKASARQRRGRAGRVQAGVCFHLFSSADHKEMEEFQLPEMLRTPLESLCLQVKALNLGDVESFLKKAIQPPDVRAIHNALELLRVIGAISAKQENLTSLGFHLASLPVDPRLGKMLLYSVVFRCMDPVLTIASSLGFRNPFVMPLNKKEEADAVKRGFAGNRRSDHAAYLRAYEEWKCAGGVRRGGEFAWRRYLSHSSLCMIDEMRSQFRRLLQDSGFIRGDETGLNDNSNCWSLVLAVLAAGLYPNVARIDFGRKRLKVSTKNDGVLKMHPSSVNRSDTNFDHHWLVFYEKVRSSSLFILDSSSAPPAAFLLFGGDVKLSQSSARHPSTERVLTVESGDHNIGSGHKMAQLASAAKFLSFTADTEDAALAVVQLRLLIEYMVTRRLRQSDSRNTSGEDAIVEATKHVLDESMRQTYHVRMADPAAGTRADGDEEEDGDDDDGKDEARTFRSQTAFDGARGGRGPYRGRGGASARGSGGPRNRPYRGGRGRRDDR